MVRDPSENETLERTYSLQAVLAGEVLLARLDGAGSALPLITEQFHTLNDIRIFLRNLGGMNRQKEALAYWFVKELFPDVDIAYILGVTEQDIEAGEISLYPALEIDGEIIALSGDIQGDLHAFVRVGRGSDSGIFLVPDLDTIKKIIRRTSVSPLNM